MPLILWRLIISLNETEKCLVVLSGGLDSTVVAYWAKKHGYHVHCLTFKYGQIAEKEVKHAIMISKKLGVSIKIIDMSCLKEIFVGITALCDRNIALTSNFTEAIVVPFRNGIFLSVAVAYAHTIGARKIFYGAQGSDASCYPDCREEFYKSFERTARLGTDRKFQINAPFSNVPKSELIRVGTTLSVPFQLTWSCYLDKDHHCGKCESCMNRKNAFKEANIPDPTEYLE